MERSKQAGREPILTEAERELLDVLSAAGKHRRELLSSMIREQDGRWRWEFRLMQSPGLFDTREQALDLFERYVEVLNDALSLERLRADLAER